jgi:hypothetical protein
MARFTHENGSHEQLSIRTPGGAGDWVCMFSLVINLRDAAAELERLIRTQLSEGPSQDANGRHAA